MKIGDLFVALGFKVQGEKSLKDVTTSLKHAAGVAGTAAIALNGITAAFVGMMVIAANAAVGMKNFSLQTGLSVDELQKWQHVAAVNDVTGDELTKTIVGLQNAASSFKLGDPQSVSAWAMLGVNPLQDPFKVMQDLRSRLSKVKDVGVARNLAERVGISDNVFQMLRASNGEFEKWNKNLEMAADQRAGLLKLNAAWKDIFFSVTALKNKFAAEFAPVLTRVTRVIKVLVDELARFVEWLHKGSPMAKAVMRILIGIMAAVVVLGIALAGLTAVIGVLIVALTALDVVGFPVIVVITAIGVVIGILIGLIAGIILMVQDLWTALKGGESYFNWGLSIAIVKGMGDAFDYVLDKWNKLKSALTGADRIIKGAVASLPKWAQVALMPGVDLGKSLATDAPKGSGGDVKQENTTTINIDGANDPKTTGKEVRESLKDVFNNASRQMPVLNY